MEGNIGAGKSSFLSYIMEKYGDTGLFAIHDEPIETWRNLRGNNLLEMFYNKPEKYGFLMQVRIFPNQFLIILWNSTFYLITGGIFIVCEIELRPVDNGTSSIKSKRRWGQEIFIFCTVSPLINEMF